MSLADYFDVEKIQQIANKVKNAVLNYTEYQAKVMEATNNDHWGASSTLMQDIANATNNSQHFMDIMETLYKKLVEKGGNWRQCYKALQLLEYLIKNGSERCVDNAKDHVYELKGLLNFVYFDEKGKNQGVNGIIICNYPVKNRANEIISLLADTQKIREERRKAKENRNKYTGASSSSSSFGGPSFGAPGKYGGFGSESFRSGGGGFRDETPSPPRSKYDEPVAKPKANKPAESPKVVAKSQPQPDLLDMDNEQEDEWGEFTSVAPAAKPTSGLDDFTDFTSALPSERAQQNNNGFTSFQYAPTTQSKPSGNGFNAFAPQTTSNGYNAFTQPTSNVTAKSTNNGFNSFSATHPSTNSPVMQLQDGFTSPDFQPTPFTSFPARPIPSSGFSAPSSQQQQQQNNFTSQPGFASLSQPLSGINPQLAKKDDPFSKLVSLDANSLSGQGKKQDLTSRPTLNAIGSQQAQAHFAKPVASNGGMAMSNGGGYNPKDFDTLI